MTRQAHWGLLLVLLFTLTACAGPAGGTRQAQPPAAATPARPVAARVVRVRVDEKNLLLAGRAEARRYLLEKLAALATRQLTGFGYATASAARLAATGRFQDLVVAGKQARVPGRGEQAGRITDTTLWHVSGSLEVVLDDAAVSRLGNELAALPVDSLEAARQLWGYLQKYEKLRAPADSLEKLRRRLSQSWAAALRPVLEAVRTLPVKDSQLGQRLTRVTRRLAEFAGVWPGCKELADMQKILARAWWKWLQQLAPVAADSAALDERLAELHRSAGGHLPAVERFVRQALELAWRDHLNRLDDRKQPFPSVRRDFLGFLQRFPRSRFYPELELRFLARWVEYLLAARPRKVDELPQLIGEVRLLHERFPGVAQGRQVQKLLGQHCQRLLGQVELGNLDRVQEVERILQQCEPYLPSGMETLAMRQRLDRIAEHLRAEREDRREQQVLKGLNFFLEWNRAISSLPFGEAMTSWPGRGAFAEKWRQGSDAGADCHCSLDPDEPCRVFGEDGPHGGYEVVARILEGHLAGVDLCDVYVGEKLPDVYRFLLRRYPRRHTRRQADLLLGSGNGEVAFGRPPGLLVWLACRDGTCSLRVRQARAFARMRQQAEQESARLREQRRQRRRERIARGWQPGACVRWDCSAGCLYRGRVEKKQGEGYQVVVIECRDDARQVGSRLWVKAEELFDCH